MNKDELHDEIIEDLGGQITNGQLPQFINVLTILTFIGSGLALLGGFYNIATPEQQQQQINDFKNSRELNLFGPEFIEQMQVMLDNLYLIQGSAIAASIACLIGAYLMRKLNKTGYYLYIAGSVISVIVPIAVLGFGLMGIIVMLSSIFTIAFVIMYSVNVKYLS